MSHALKIARNNLLSTSNKEKVIVILTDGEPDSPEATMKEGDLTKNSNIRIIAIGVGNEINFAFLKQLASAPEDYHFVNESFELESTFINIATELASGKIQINKGD